MVLDMYDLHPNTHCRNEPDGGTLLDGVEQFFAVDVPDGFQEKWKAALGHVAATSGKRDRLPVRDKHFLKPGLVSQFMNWGQSKRRMRPWLGLGDDDWPCPVSVYDRAAFARALPVFKIIVSGSVVLAHEDPGQILVHVMRRPDAFLNSWYNRYVIRSGRRPETLFAESEPVRTRVLAHYGADPAPFETYSLQKLLESELWLWRYTNDRLYGLKGSPRYLPLIYDDIRKNPVETAEAIYRHAGLDYDQALLDRHAHMEKRIFANKHSTTVPEDAIAAAIDMVCQDTGLPL